MSKDLVDKYKYLSKQQIDRLWYFTLDQIFKRLKQGKGYQDLKNKLEVLRKLFNSK